MDFARCDGSERTNQFRCANTAHLSDDLCLRRRLHDTKKVLTGCRAPAAQPCDDRCVRLPLQPCGTQTHGQSVLIFRLAIEKGLLDARS